MASRLPIALIFVSAGILHFLRPGMYESIMPDALPAHRELVYASGVAEIAGGIAVLPQKSARWGGWFLIATLAAVFPANVNMAINPERFSKIPESLLWLRLPLQALLMAWVWAVTIRRR